MAAPNRRGRDADGIDAHRCELLPEFERTVERGIPCTTVARTLVDLAGVVSMAELRKAVAEAEVLRILDFDAVEDVVNRNRGRRGVARLRAVVSGLHPSTRLARGELERRFLDLCDRAGLPPPEVNSKLSIGGRIVVPDFLWREPRLIVETDGRQFHDTASAFERDRRRDQLLNVAGWTVIRSTWRQVVDEPAQLGRTLRSLLT